MKAFTVSALFVGLLVWDGCDNESTNPILACLEPPPGLLSWWPGDGNANDIVGENHGTIKDTVSFAPGIVDNAFRFRGLNDYIEISAPNLQSAPDGSFTFGLWFKTNFDTDLNRGIATHFGPTIPSQWFAIMLSGEESSAVCKELVGGVLTPKPNHVVVGLRDVFGNHISLCSDNPLNDGEYHHVSGSYDGSTKTLTGYFDGESSGFVPGPAGSAGEKVGSGQVQNLFFTSIDWTQPFFFANHVNRFFPLDLDELEFYNRALDLAEIQAIVNASSAGKCKP